MAQGDSRVNVEIKGKRENLVKKDPKETRGQQELEQVISSLIELRFLLSSLF